MERDYGVWKFSGKEKAKLILSYLGLCGELAFLSFLLGGASFSCRTSGVLEEKPGKAY